MRSWILSLPIVLGLFSNSGASTLPPSPPAPASTPAPSLAVAPRADAGDAPDDLGDPDYPLQAWMKSHLLSATISTDFTRLERSFDSLATMDPGGFGRWTEIARSGARGAANRDLDAVRSACKHCHDDYRRRYRAERRAAPL